MQVCMTLRSTMSMHCTIESCQAYLGTPIQSGGPSTISTRLTKPNNNMMRWSNNIDYSGTVKKRSTRSDKPPPLCCQVLEYPNRETAYARLDEGSTTP
eukprot:c43138_g1_i1 orf=421-714(+)